MGAKVAAMQMVDLFNVSATSRGVDVVATKLDDASADMLRTMGDDIKSKKENMVAVLSAVNGDKVSLLCVCGAAAVKKGAHAGKIIKEVAKIVGGGGGGRPDSATAGGKNPAKLEEALGLSTTSLKQCCNKLLGKPQGARGLPFEGRSFHGRLSVL